MSSHADNVLVDEVVPRLRHLIPHHVAFVGAEDAEEVLQDATLMAARILARARANGKAVTPGNVAYYTMLHIRCGRRSHSAGRSDAMGTRTQIVGTAACSPWKLRSLPTMTFRTIRSHSGTCSPARPKIPLRRRRAIWTGRRSSPRWMTARGPS